ncbi:PepSY-associated TM helix domain-containing protein [Pannonibacter sp. Pt2-lr]
MTDVVSGTAQDADRAADASLLAAFYRAAWRWHFYAGLFAVPFFCILAVTGMMMMYIGYFDGRDGENIRVSVPQGAVAMAVSEQADKAVAALGAAPWWNGSARRLKTGWASSASAPMPDRRWWPSTPTLAMWWRPGAAVPAGMTWPTTFTATFAGHARRQDAGDRRRFRHYPDHYRPLHVVAA